MLIIYYVTPVSIKVKSDMFARYPPAHTCSCLLHHRRCLCHSQQYRLYVHVVQDIDSWWPHLPQDQVSELSQALKGN